MRCGNEVTDTNERQSPRLTDEEWQRYIEADRAEQLELLKKEIAYHDEQAAEYRELLAEAERDPSVLDW